MKNRLLTAAFALGSLMYANAQETTIYYQDFEAPSEEIFDEGWDYYPITGDSDLDGTVNANTSTQNAGISGASIGIASFTLVNNVPQHIDNIDNVLMSPRIVVPQGNSYLSYRVGSLYISGIGNATYSLYALTNEEIMEIDNAGELKTFLDGQQPLRTATLSTGSSTVVNVSLNEFAGEEMTFYYRLHNTQGNRIVLVDDVAVKSGTLGINENNSDFFAVYPNPAHNFIIINSNNLAGLESISIADLNGRTVTQQQFTGGNAAQMDISWLNSGMYFVTIASDKGTATKKIIKQ